MMRCWQRLMRLAALTAAALSLSAVATADENDGIAALRERLAVGDLLQAELGARRSLSQAEAADGSPSLLVAQLLDVIVESRLRQWFYTDPEVHKYASRALEIKGRLLDPEHPRGQPSRLDTVRPVCG